MFVLLSTTVLTVWFVQEVIDCFVKIRDKQAFFLTIETYFSRHCQYRITGVVEVLKLRTFDYQRHGPSLNKDKNDSTLLLVFHREHSRSRNISRCFFGRGSGLRSSDGTEGVWQYIFPKWTWGGRPRHYIDGSGIIFQKRFEDREVRRYRRIRSSRAPGS